MNFPALIRAKTFWLGLTMLVGGIVLITHGDYVNGIQGCIGGLGMIFIRDAIANSGK